MNLCDKVSAYFYAIVLSLWSVSIPLADYNGSHSLLPDLETTDEKLYSLDQSDIYFLASQYNNFLGAFRTDGSNHLDHYFNHPTFQHLYLKNFYASTRAFLEAVDVKFEFIDLIFPFHYFW